MLINDTNKKHEDEVIDSMRVALLNLDTFV